MGKRGRNIVIVLLLVLFIMGSWAPIIPQITSQVYAAEKNIVKPSITEAKKTLYVGYQSHTIKIKNLSKKAKITYLSSNKKVATVSKKGVVKPMKEGEAIIDITIKQNGKHYISKVTIKVINPSIEISSFIKEIDTGDNYTWVGKTNGITKAKFSWSSSDTEVATIDKKTGLLTAISEGSTTVTLEETKTKLKQEMTLKVNRSPNQPYQAPKGSDYGVYLSGLDLSSTSGAYYTTTREEYIDTTRFIIYLGKNTAVPVNVIELVNHEMDLIEETTGYDFYVEPRNEYEYLAMDIELKKYFNNADQWIDHNTNREKVKIIVTEHDIDVEAYAVGGAGIVLRPEHLKLLDGKGDALLHELLHVVCHRNGPFLRMVLAEGFTTYYTMKIIEKDKKLNYSYDAYSSLSNYQNPITENTMESLFLNMTSGQSAYSLGFRMMHFIDETYGLSVYRKIQEEVDRNYKELGEVPIAIIADAIKTVCGDNYFKDFANWHKNNMTKFGDIDRSSMGEWFIEHGYLRKYYGNDVHVVVPNTVTNIQPEAFMGNKTIQTIEIPNTVTAICDGAFFDSSLQEITIPDTVTILGANAFENCHNLKQVTLSKNIERIEARTFMNCTSLLKVTFPEGVQSIDNAAFLGCTSLKEMILPSTLKSISSLSFSECSNLETIIIPNGVVLIDEYAFKDCEKLKKVVLPNTLLAIEEGVFWGCASLKSIELPNKLTSIQNSAFNFSDLITVSIPDTVKEIGDFAFASIKNLKEIYIPTSVKSIGKETFYGSDQVVIWGVKGSYAETYAKEHEIKFKINK